MLTCAKVAYNFGAGIKGLRGCLRHGLADSDCERLLPGSNLASHNRTRMSEISLMPTFVAASRVSAT